MVTKAKLVEGISADCLKASFKEIIKMSNEEITADIKEVGEERVQLFKRLADLHQKESILVNRARALELEERILSET